MQKCFIRGEVRLLGKCRFRGWKTNVAVMYICLLSGRSVASGTNKGSQDSRNAEAVAGGADEKNANAALIR